MSELFDGNGAFGGNASLADNQGRPRCRASVHRSDGWGFAQCGKVGKHQDAAGIWWCSTHEPERRKVREAETVARQKAAYERDSQSFWYGHLGVKYRDALRQIAAGHNDPCSLAREVLGDDLGATKP